MPELHARLSPSNKRWPHCPGSIREEAHYPDVAGPAAIDGTGSHLLLEMSKKAGCPAKDFEGQVVGQNHHDMPLGWVVHIDRAERVQMCLDYVARRVDELRAEYPESVVEVASESKSDPGRHYGRDDWWGTCDITITVTNPRGGMDFLEVVDFKDGRGWVHPKDNSQLISYAVGKMPMPSLSEDDGNLIIRMTIVQPRTSPVVRYDERPWNELHQEGFLLSMRAKDTDDPDAPVLPGWWCRWCKANPKNGGHCMKCTEHAVEELDVKEFNKLIELDVRTATEDQLAEVADLEPHLLRVQEAMDRVKDEIKSRLEQSLPVTGWGMAPGRGRRVWRDPEEVLAVLKKTSLKLDDFAPRSLLTPAQAEKVVSKRTFEGKIKHLIEDVPGAMKPKRVSVQSEPKDAKDMFSSAPKPVSFA